MYGGNVVANARIIYAVSCREKTRVASAPIDASVVVKARCESARMSAKMSHYYQCWSRLAALLVKVGGKIAGLPSARCQ